MLYNPARRDTAIDQALVWSAVLLASFGLVMVYSSSIAMAEASTHAGFRSWYFLARHATFLAAGAVAAHAPSRAATIDTLTRAHRRR